MIREVRRFTGTGDDGQTYTVVELVEVIHAGTMRNPDFTFESEPVLELDNGLAVDAIDNDTFKVVPTGVIVKKEQVA